MTIIGLLACTALIIFDAIFIAQPTTCLLTSSCAKNADSNTTFDYNFRRSFYSKFNSWDSFESFTERDTKHFFQTIQVSVGSFCFVLCIIYLIVYYICKSKSKAEIAPSAQSQNQQQQQQQQQPTHGRAIQPVYPGWADQQQSPRAMVAPAWQPTAPYVAQVQPAQVHWYPNRRY